MKFVDEYRERQYVERLTNAILRTARQRWVLMEVCGGQTHSIVRYGLDRLIGESVELLHGPGCPVCVTPLETIDKAHAIAAQQGVILCSYGDMLRVPGSHGDLFALRARGADVRVVYSPLDAVSIAQQNSERQVVLLAIGFETTAPANAMAIEMAARQELANMSFLVSHVLVPPALTSILQAPNSRVQGFLGPGHVCTVMGTREYAAIAKHYRVPIVVTGFEPVDLLEGILRAVRQLERGAGHVENQYGRVVSERGNSAARACVDRVFEVVDKKWRGVGVIPKSGHRIRYEYRHLDAERRFSVSGIQADEPKECISGQVLRGLRLPTDCPAFGTRCTPESPLGATMVSAEGACAAYHAYGRQPKSTLTVLDESGGSPA
jgi:hydrogenase expression/formation protein HypD